MIAAVSCSLFMLGAIATITLILTDLMACCQGKFKPERESRAIDRLLINPSSTSAREASHAENHGNQEQIRLEDMKSAPAEPREASQAGIPGNSEEIL